MTVMIATLIGAAGAHAKPVPDPRVDQARQHYDSGLAHFNLREFKEAIEDFEAGYRLKPDPVFLYNLGQAHRLAQNPEQALYFYRAYLRTSDDPPNRAEVEERIATLEKLIAEKRDLTRPPDHTIPPGEQATPPVEKPVQPPPATAVAAPVAAAPMVAAPPRRTPIYKKWWFWTIIGGVVVAGAVVGIAVGVTQSQNAGFNANLGTVGPNALTVRF
jgi:tetratricopeptide (TPR) repeat protein